ncbi:MAG: addiction module protein, partial [Bryobacteraceae bacterium]
ALSTEERLGLIDDLWESLEAPEAESVDAASVTDGQRRILDDRLLDLELFPDDEISLAEARKQSLI